MKQFLRTQLGTLTLQNPITVASGTFSFETNKFYDIGRLGAVFTKTITPEPKIGNGSPRIHRTEFGLLNSIGLQNPGIRAFLEKDILEYKDISCPKIVSFSASKISTFELMLEKLETCDFIDGYEINVSCPNVENEGLAFGTDATVIYDLTSKLAKRTKKELIIKLTPNVTNIAEIAKAAELGGATAVSLINTVYGMAIDWKTGKSYIKQGVAGYSGPPIKPIAMSAVYKVNKEVKIPIIAIGGISKFEDVLEFVYAGATAVAIGTAQLPEPLLPMQILSDLNDYCALNNVFLKDIRGTVKF